MWTEAQKEQMARQYLKTGLTQRCPEDHALLEINHVETLGPRIEVDIYCPLCKQRAQWENDKPAEGWSAGQKEEILKSYLRDEPSECPHCGGAIEVERHGLIGGNRDLYQLTCRNCLLYESVEF